MDRELCATLPDSDVLSFEEGEIIVRRNRIWDYATPEIQELFMLWARWEKRGTLPYAGGIEEQPAHVADVIKTLDPIYAQHQDEDRKARDRAAQIRGKKR